MNIKIWGLANKSKNSNYPQIFSFYDPSLITVQARPQKLQMKHSPAKRCH
jgi:hypothetical protein